MIPNDRVKVREREPAESTRGGAKRSCALTSSLQLSQLRLCQVCASEGPGEGGEVKGKRGKSEMEANKERKELVWEVGRAGR